MNKEPDSWITINGQHVPIFEGEGKREAVSRFINKKMSRVSKNKDKYDTIDKYKKRKATNKLKNEETKYEVSKDGNRYELSEEERKKVMRDLGKDTNELSKFDVNENKTKYVMRPEEREKVFKELGIKEYSGNRNDDYNVDNRRSSLIKFTQDNKELIDKWVNEKSSRKTIDDKVSRNEGLTLKEYYQYLNREPREGDIILAGGRNGEDVRVGKNGKLEVIDNYKKKKRSNH